MKCWRPMHELAICQALISEVAAVAGAEQARSVTDIYVRVGPLSGVEHALMRNAFPVASAGTIARDAMLHLEVTSVRVHCSECGTETVAKASRLTCGSCGNWQTQLVSGDELLLQRVVMQGNHKREAIDV